MTEQGLRAVEGGAGRDQVGSAHFEIKRVIAGQDEMLERVFVCLLAGGHLLIEGVPGLAKTLTIKTVAEVLGGTFQRVQFTPTSCPRTSSVRASTSQASRAPSRCCLRTRPESRVLGSRHPGYCRAKTTEEGGWRPTRGMRGYSECSS